MIDNIKKKKPRKISLVNNAGMHFSDTVSDVNYFKMLNNRTIFSREYQTVYTTKKI